MIVDSMHGVEAKHLVAVVKKMRKLGAPTIRCMYDGEVYKAVEGTHRLAAAAQLGLTPIIVNLDPESILPADLIAEADLDPGTKVMDRANDARGKRYYF